MPKPSSENAAMPPQPYDGGAAHALDLDKELSDAIIESAPGVFYVIDADSRLVRWNSYVNRLTGLSDEALLQIPIVSLFHPDDRAMVGAQINEVFASGYAEGSARVASHDRGTRDFFLTGRRFAAGDSVFAVGFGIDITERLRMEEALQRSAQEFEDLYNHAPCGYHSLDKDAAFIQINDTELSWLGYAREEIVGRKSFPDLLAEESVEVFNENFPLFTEHGWMPDIEFDMVRKDGSILPVMVSAVAVTDADGRFLKDRSTVFDITERKSVIREEEQKRIARELHDEMGGIFAALKFNLSSLSEKLPPQPALADRAKTLADLVDAGISTMRHIVTELRPPMLEDLGLTAAIEEQVLAFEQRTGIQCRLRVPDEERPISAECVTTVFRILQEALTNIVKHAHATAVSVAVKYRNDCILLRVRDNGAGFAMDEVRRKKSYGLLGIRERARMVGGSARIRSAPGKGTRLIAVCPMGRR